MPKPEFENFQLKRARKISGKKVRKVMLIIFLFFCLMILYMHLESRWIKIKHVTIYDSDISSDFHSGTIVFIADVHHGPFFSKKRVDLLVRRINSLDPAIVILGGDYIHRSREYIKPVFKSLSKLEGMKLGVLGNHDHWESMETTKREMENAGIINLETHPIISESGSTKVLWKGAGDYWEDHDLYPVSKSYKEEFDFVVLVTHNPDYAEEVDDTLVDLMLCGHTHGGQITLFGLWAPILPVKTGQKYRYGLTAKGEMQVYTTSGVGTITPPLRFFCRPEIVVLEFKHKKTDDK